VVAVRVHHGAAQARWAFHHEAVGSSRDTRAQLRNGDPKATLERLSAERRPSYEEAHIHVKSGDGAHKDVVDSIVAALESYLAGSDAG
jgi:shikimate kinase